jgi:hypothetical protein
MDKNLNFVAKELFGKIRTQFSNVKLGDENSEVTTKPEEARFFDFDFDYKGSPLGRITVSISEEDGLVVMYSSDIVSEENEYIKKQFFHFLKELREFSKQRLMSFDTRDISKSNLEKRDYEFLSNNTGESAMSESKLFGTSKTSYQNLGNAKIIVKHSAPVNFENPAGRAQRIESIYIENVEGERFKYPFKHLNGARALAQHVSHGGTPYDSIGNHVIGLSEELNKLRMFKHYVDRNDMVSEAMGTVNQKVSERINSIKKEISGLQSPKNYEVFAESFTEHNPIEIPEELINDWIDRLTIRTFNEELKNVFPYIFKLVDESDIPVKELNVEDLIAEDSEETLEDLEGEVPELDQYESMLNQIVEGSSELFSKDESSQQAAIETLDQLINDTIPVGIDGNNAIESLSGIIEDEELFDIFKELADVNEEFDIRSILKDYIEIKDKENGTNVLSQLTFGGIEEPTDEVPVDEPTPEPAADPAADPAAAAAAPAPAPAAPPAPVTASIDNSGNRFAEAIRKAVNAGMQLEDTFTVSGKTVTLKDAIEKSGLTVENFFHNKEISEKSELIEFVKSMFNQEEGNFPKGETGVLIACEKKFGEQSIPMAQKVVEKLTSFGETNRMKKLAGMGEAGTNNFNWSMDTDGKKTSGNDQAGYDQVMNKFKGMSKGIGSKLGLGDVDVSNADSMQTAIQNKVKGMMPKGMPGQARPAAAPAAAPQDPKAMLQKMPAQQIASMNGDQAKRMLTDLKKMAGLTK